MSSDNFIISDSVGKSISLKEKSELRINFNLQKKEQKSIEEIFKITLFNNNKEGDSCEIRVLINVIPLILRFSINEMYVKKENNNLYFYNYLNKWNISHTLPGGYHCKKLGTILLTNNLTQEELKLLQTENEGNISLSLINDNNYNYNYEVKKSSISLDLRLKNLSLLNVNLNFNVPPFFGLKI